MMCNIFRFGCHWSNRCLVDLLMVKSWFLTVNSTIIACDIDCHLNETRLISLGARNPRSVKYYLMIAFSPYSNAVMGGSVSFLSLWYLLFTITTFNYLLKESFEVWDFSWTELWGPVSSRPKILRSRDGSVIQIWTSIPREIIIKIHLQMTCG